MKLEQQVCSLELAKKLKELGVKQESLFYWYSLINSWRIDNKKSNESDISAFTVAELGEMLPSQIKYMGYVYEFVMTKNWTKKGWYANYEKLENKVRGMIEGVDTEADARAKMLIYLLENKLITL